MGYYCSLLTESARPALDHLSRHSVRCPAQFVNRHTVGENPAYCVMSTRAWREYAASCSFDSHVGVLGICHSQHRHNGDSDADGCHCGAYGERWTQGWTRRGRVLYSVCTRCGEVVLLDHRTYDEGYSVGGFLQSVTAVIDARIITAAYAGPGAFVGVGAHLVVDQ